MSAVSPPLVLPEWQDDSDVTACPICKRTFHFLFRKHHCRRCGRIICDQCSPHRITLPRQYIVRPPWEASRFRIDTGDDEDILTSDPALGGGETVRVCNPCVPDPNYGPPPSQSVPAPEPDESRALEGISGGPSYDYHRDPNRASTFTSPQRSPERSYPERYRATGNGDATSPTRRSQNATAYYTHGHGRSGSNASNAAHRVLHARMSLRGSRSQFPPPVPTASRPIPPLTSADTSGMPDRDQSGSVAPAYTHIFATPGSQFPSSSHFPGLGQSPSRPPLRQIAPRTSATQPPPPPVREEDECPVCGTHASPFGPGGDESAREVHIQSCIENHLQFSSTPRSQTIIPPPQPPMPVDSPESGSPSTFNAARLPSLTTSTSSVSPPQPTQPIPPRTSSHSATASTSTPASLPTSPSPLPPRSAGYQRMLLFHATEKDCQPDTTTGEPPECVICFEEFSPGQEMGRLECLCKFHRPCIRAWWESSPAPVGPVQGGAQQQQQVQQGQGQAAVGQEHRRGERWGTCPTHVLHH